MKIRTKLTAAGLLFLGGAAMYLAVEDVAKGALLVLGSVLLDLGIDEAVLIWEKWRGEIPSGEE